jgi:apolipoprotein N-acyltransferase
VLAVRGRSFRAAFAHGVLFGVAFFGVLLTWLLNLGVLPWLLLTGTQSVAPGVLGALTAAAWRLPARLVTVPCAWVAVEAVRGRFPLGGFPWGRLGSSQADAPSAGWVAVGGIPLLSWLVAATGVAVVAAVTARGSWRALTAAGAAALLALGGPALPASGAGQDVAPRVVVAVVQGNVPRARTVAEQARAARVTDNHVAATRALAAEVRAGRVPAPDLVVWPESSTDVDPGRDRRVYDLIAGAVADVGVPVLVGAVLDTADGRVRNVGQLWLPGMGPGAVYQKRHLVPFGEYIPYRRLLGGLGDLALVTRDFVPGTGPQLVTAGPIRIGDVICYEVAYDDTHAQAVQAGANLLVVQSNNASYMRDGQTGETEQQLAMARLRAREHDRAVVVATPTGISAIVRPDGTVEARTGIWQAQTLVAELELRTTQTWSDRVGERPEQILTAGVLAVPVLAVTQGRRRRDSSHRGSTPP